MYPDKIARPDYFSQFLEEELICLFITLKISLPEDSHRREIMKQRPDKVIAEPSIEFLIHLIRYPDSAEFKSLPDLRECIQPLIIVLPLANPHSFLHRLILAFGLHSLRE